MLFYSPTVTKSLLEYPVFILRPFLLQLKGNHRLFLGLPLVLWREDRQANPNNLTTCIYIIFVFLRGQLGAWARPRSFWDEAHAFVCRLFCNLFLYRVLLII